MKNQKDGWLSIKNIAAALAKRCPGLDPNIVFLDIVNLAERLTDDGRFDPSAFCLRDGLPFTNLDALLWGALDTKDQDFPKELMVRSSVWNGYLTTDEGAQWLADRGLTETAITHFNVFPLIAGRDNGDNAISQMISPILNNADVKLELATINKSDSTTNATRHRSASTPILEAAVHAELENSGIPGSSTPWGRFNTAVRVRCEKTENDRGYGDKSIQRIVRMIKSGRKDK